MSETRQSIALPTTRIVGLGTYAPGKVLTNDDLCSMVDTSDEWIVSRTGIRERRFANDNEFTSDMAAEAARRAMADADVTPEDIDLLVVATITPDMAFPSTACLTQAKLGLSKVCSFDLEAACSGFLYALDVADALLKTREYRRALVIGAEKLSSIMDWKDRTTCVLFGDGAGAAVLAKGEGSGAELRGFFLEADGSNPSLLCQPGGGSAQPASSDSLRARQHFLKMNGKEIFKVAVRLMERAALELLEKHGLTPADVVCVIPHQANARIVESLAQRLELPMDRFFCNLDRYGNTSAASIPIALNEARQERNFSNGDHILMVAFGAGLTWASGLLRWTK
ncbi:MAG: beta-ketoacyl-ACP synthase III [Opitutales bacterium]|jgi:3-oxoacyl-[acyl-carrier-protein] synthase III